MSELAIQEKCETSSILKSELPKIVPVLTFKNWVHKYESDLNKYGVEIIQLKDIYNEDIVMSKKESNGRRRVYSLHDVHQVYIPDMTPINFFFYRGNLFRTTFKASNSFELEDEYDFYIRTYYYRSATLCNFSISLGDHQDLLPYHQKILKDRSMLFLESPDLHDIASALQAIPDVERYISKFSLLNEAKEKLFTNSHFIKWMFKKYSYAYDINTHVIIDNILLDVIKTYTHDGNQL